MQFARMPQGYKNSPAIFMRAMLLILGDLVNKACVVYIDDILVFGRDIEEHDKNLQLVLERLSKYNLKENKDKRIERKEQIRFLGFDIELNKIKPSSDRAQGIVGYPEPKNRKDLQRFLGLVNYDRKFINNLSERLKTLYCLLGKEKKFIWTAKESAVFNEIKQIWAENLELRIPDMTKQFVLEADASSIGIGAVLIQDGQPVAFTSRCLSQAEKNYSITEREVLAALWSMEKFQYYLLGRRFVLETDHKAIEELKRKKEFGSARIMRWFDRLERFQFDIVYKKGEEVIAADALSRAPEVFSIDKQNKNIVEEKVLEIHRNAAHRKNIMEKINDNQLLVSRAELRKILEKCLTCCRKDRKHVKTGYHIETSYPGERVAIDLLDINSKEKVVLAIDYFTRKIFGKVLSDKSSHKILDFIKSLIAKIKIKTLQVDNGREFNNAGLKKLAEREGIELKFTIPYYHAGNGRIERANRTIREALKKTAGALKQKLPKVIESYNNTHHRGIGMTPEEAMMQQNSEKVKINMLKYSNEFKRHRRKIKSFKEGDLVLLKKEIKRNKMDDEFHDQGKVEKVLGNNKYVIRHSNNNLINKHASQLRGFERGMLDTKSIH